jgi:adenine phosphoribosyltransferase
MTLTDDLVARIDWIDGHSNVWCAFADQDVFPRLIEALAEPYASAGITHVAGIEARGFLLGAAVAARLRAGFVAIRKGDGLLPGAKHVRTAPPDYRGNSACLRLQQDALGRGDRVLLVDDWFETGSQAITARALIEDAGGDYAGSSIVVDQLTAPARDRRAPVAALMPFSALRPDDA